MNLNEFVNRLSSGALDEKLKKLYGPSDRSLLRNKARYLSAAEIFSRLYPECSDIRVFSAPGGIEICGGDFRLKNGKTLAAAVDLDFIAISALNDEGIIEVKIEGGETYSADINDIDTKPSTYEPGAGVPGILRDIASSLGTELSGFYAYINSDKDFENILSLSGSVGILLSKMLGSFFNGGKTEQVKLGEHIEAYSLAAELAAAAGGFVLADAGDAKEADVTQIERDLAGAGYSLCLTSAFESKLDFAERYSAESIEAERLFDILGACDEDGFYEKLPELRESCGDRAVLKAAHFFADSRRAELGAEALQISDTEEFFRLVNESGLSAAELLQNTYSLSSPESQSIAVGLMLSRRFLGENGAVRAQDGGFAGTIEAFVPAYLAEDYRAEMERVFGEGSCLVLDIRPVGACELTI